MTPSLRSSIQRTRPEERGNKDRGRVTIAVTRVAYALSNAFNEWKNCNTYSGWQALGGYMVGLSKDGMTMRWMVFEALELIAV
jgi:hypothetical protein